MKKGHFSYLLPAYELGKRSRSREAGKPGGYPKPGDHSQLDIIRVGERIGFTFNHEDWQPGIVVQFTDGADLRWQIDSDLHLQEVIIPRHGRLKWPTRMFGIAS